MKNILLLFALLFVSIKGSANLVEFSESPARGYSLIGFNDEEVGRQKSLQQNKPLLIVFLGMDWCPWSKKFYGDVLEKRKVFEEMEGIILAIENIPEEDTERSEALRDKYGVQELPGFILTNARGEVISHFGYLPLQAKEFICYIKDMVQKYDEIIIEEKDDSLSNEGFEALYRKAKDLGWRSKADELLQKGLALSKGTFFYLEKYASILAATNKKNAESIDLKRKIMLMDPKNAQGSMLKLAILDFELLEKNKKKDPQKIISPLVSYLKEFGQKDSENTWKVEWMIGQFLFSRDKIEDALKHVKISYEMAPEDSKKEIGESMHYIETCINQSSAMK